MGILPTPKEKDIAEHVGPSLRSRRDGIQEEPDTVLKKAAFGPFFF
jgi:hypothetical protein